MGKIDLINLLRHSRPTRVAVTLIAVVVLSAATSISAHDLLRWEGSPEFLLTRFGAHLIMWGTCAIGFAVVLPLRARATRSGRLRPGLRLLVELLLMVAYAAVIVPLSKTLVEVSVGLPTLPNGGDIRMLLPMMLMRAMVMYAVVVLCVTSLQNYARHRDQEEVTHARVLREELLVAQLASARLDALRAQLHPHTLFNALHAIGGLVLEGEKKTAHRALVDLAELLRRSIRHADSAVVPVLEEIELIEKYFALEQLRLGERLRVDIQVAPDARLGEVPSLLLLPIVENAVRHGISASPAGGTVTVRIDKTSEELAIVVEDDGVGLNAQKSAPEEEGGVGLQNCTERLRNMYGEAATLRIMDRKSRGVRVTVHIPFSLSGQGMEQASA